MPFFELQGTSQLEKANSALHTVGHNPGLDSSVGALTMQCGTVF